MRATRKQRERAGGIRGGEVIRAECAEYRDKVAPIIGELRAQGFSCPEIAAELNRRGIRTKWRREWSRESVSLFCMRHGIPSDGLHWKIRRKLRKAK